MDSQKLQSGFAHLIIVIILTIGLIGTLGFIYWQGFIKKDNNTSQTRAAENKNNNDSDNGVGVTSDWTKLDTEYFTMPIPDGWKLDRMVYDGEYTGIINIKNGLTA